MDSMELLFSRNAKGMKKSVIRELLKLTQKPEIISLAGGLPAPQTFPVEDIRKSVLDVLDNNSSRALQYGSTEGYPAFRQKLSKLMLNDGIKNVELENILITTGSQQALDLIGRIFIDPGDTVVVGLPSYVGALGAFNAYSAQFIGVEIDDNGMNVEALAEKLEKFEKKSIFPKFIYTIPDFQNPAGVTLSLERRKKLIELAEKYEIFIIEDCPYRRLRYSGEPIPTILELDNGGGHVIALNTFSKIFAPGFRLGWITASKAIIDKLVIAKQSVDLCTPVFIQCIADDYLSKDLLDNNVKENIMLYKEKRDWMFEALDKYMGDLKELGFRWTKPDGGLFLWVTLPKNLDADELFYNAIDEKVAYVIGSAFYSNGKGHNTLRLNFSYPSKEEIFEGVRRLALVFKNSLSDTMERGVVL